MQNQTTRQPVTGDEALGLELLDDGSFRIGGLECPADQPVRKLKLHGLEIDRSVKPNSVLKIQKEGVVREYVFRDGAWFNQQQEVLNEPMADVTPPPLVQRNDDPSVPKPGILAAEPSHVTFDEVEVQFSIIGNRQGFVDELLSRYIRRFIEIAPPNAHCGLSRFDEASTGTRTAAFFRVVDDFYHIMLHVRTLFIERGDICCVVIRVSRAWSIEHTDDAFNRPWKHFFLGPVKLILTIGLGLVTLPLAFILSMRYGASRALKFQTSFNADIENAFNRKYHTSNYVSRYQPVELRAAADGFVHSCVEKNVLARGLGDDWVQLKALWQDEETDRWQHHNSLNISVDEQTELATMLGLSKQALFRSCADMGLKANDLKSSR